MGHPSGFAREQTWANPPSIGYSYDEFNRLSGVDMNDGLSFSYTYDRYGNRWAQNLTAGSGPSSSVAFDVQDNEMYGFTYDAAGNVTYDGTNSYAYDADGNLVSFSGTGAAGYIFDALNHRVQTRISGGAITNFVFNTAGQKVSVWDSSSGNEIEGKAYWGSRPAEYYAAGSAHFEHQDWIGTERLRTSYNGQVEGAFSSFAFGDGFGVTGGVSDGEQYHFADSIPILNWAWIMRSSGNTARRKADGCPQTPTTAAWTPLIHRVSTAIAMS